MHICTEHQISQSQYDQWRDQFVAHAARAFEVHQHTRKEPRPGAALGHVTWIDVCRHDVPPLVPRQVFGAAA
jgi:hypothetical protein